MVLLNYQQFISEQLEKQISKYNIKVNKACSTPSFKELLIKIYQYCEEVNVIEHRMKILAKQTEKIKGIKPKLLDSEINKVKHKTKEIGSSYSIFLFQQQRIKLASQEANFYQAIIKLIIDVLQTCFNKQDFLTLREQINRLFRTNTFNRTLCWKSFVQHEIQEKNFNRKLRVLKQSDYRSFRRKLQSEHSQIRPYVNNQSCFRSKYTRSPVVSLIHPNSQYLGFNLKQQEMKRFKKMI